MHRFQLADLRVFAFPNPSPQSFYSNIQLAHDNHLSPSFLVLAPTSPAMCTRDVAAMLTDTFQSSNPVTVTVTVPYFIKNLHLPLGIFLGFAQNLATLGSLKKSSTLILLY